MYLENLFQSTYYAPGTLLDTGDTMVKTQASSLLSWNVPQGKQGKYIY